MNTQASPYRYPGTRSFEREEQDIFFGRSEETRRLFAQMNVESLVVLFAKSGIGKSSLINAGLAPLLDLEAYLPIKVRFQNTAVTPVEALKTSLAPYMDENLLAVHGGAPDHPGWWEYLRACRFERYGEAAMPILILDQFEEFFAHPADAQRDFILDLADIVSRRLPNRVRDHLLNIPIEDRTDADMDWHEPPQLKVLMAIRSDRLSLLNQLSAEIPRIFDKRFELLPLRRTQAREAITAPAALPDPGFATPPFEFAEPILQLALDELTDKSETIESFQLQLVCQHLETQLEQRIKTGQATPPYIIDETFIDDREDIQAILKNYYDRAINALPKADRRLAQEFIETGLIVGGRRVGVTEGVEQERYGVHPGLLSALINSRLLRVENTHLGRSFEISHDALVPAILQSFEKRKRLEDAAAAEKARQEREREMAEELEKRSQAERLEHERRRRRQTSAWAIAASMLAGMAIVAWIFAIKQQNKAERQTEKVKSQSQELQLTYTELSNKEQERINALLSLHAVKTRIFLNANEPYMARQELITAEKLSPSARDSSWFKTAEAEIEKHEGKSKSNKKR